MRLKLTDDPTLLAQADNPRFVTVFGVDIGDKPVDVSHLPDEFKATLKSNPFFVEAGGRQQAVEPPKASLELTPADHRKAIIAELKAMGVTFAKNAKIDVLAALLTKAKGPAVPVPADEDPQRAELIAQLEGLGVEFDPNADIEALEAALDAATAPTED